MPKAVPARPRKSARSPIAIAGAPPTTRFAARVAGTRAANDTEPIACYTVTFRTGKMVHRGIAHQTTKKVTTEVSGKRATGRKGGAATQHHHGPEARTKVPRGATNHATASDDDSARARKTRTKKVARPKTHRATGKSVPIASAPSWRRGRTALRAGRSIARAGTGTRQAARAHPDRSHCQIVPGLDGQKEVAPSYCKTTYHSITREDRSLRKKTKV